MPITAIWFYLENMADVLKDGTEFSTGQKIKCILWFPFSASKTVLLPSMKKSWYLESHVKNFHSISSRREEEGREENGGEKE